MRAGVLVAAAALLAAREARAQDATPRCPPGQVWSAESVRCVAPPSTIHVEQRRESGVAAAGGSLFAVFYILAPLLCDANYDHERACSYTFVPVIGPALAAVDLSDVSDVARGGYIALGMLQVAGLACLLAGLTSHEVQVPDAPRVAVLPYLSSTSAGVAVTLRAF